MSLHTFVGNTELGTNRKYFGNASPSAPDGNTYQINDVVVNTGYPTSSAITAGTGYGWICTTGGVGGTAVFAPLGSSSQTQVAVTQFTHVYGASGPPLTTTTGTDTFGIATVTWVTEVYIPSNMTLTGVSYLIGSVGGTDKVVVALFGPTGAVLAHSALDSSVTVGTTATMQRVPFTATYAALGPGLYFIGVSTNGVTAKIRTQAFGDNNAGEITGGTFNTVVAITPPATFTASTGPIVMLY